MSPGVSKSRSQVAHKGANEERGEPASPCMGDKCKSGLPQLQAPQAITDNAAAHRKASPTLSASGTASPVSVLDRGRRSLLSDTLAS